MKIIGISGKKRSGKDTVAQILRTSCVDPSLTYYFASPLKAEVALATGCRVDYIDQFKDNFRLILQGWGTDYRRKLYGDDYWIKKMKQAIDTFERMGTLKLLIIADVRFKNEYDFLKSYGATLLRVERAGLPVDGHVSETELDGMTFDHVIPNNGTLDELINTVRGLKI